MCNLRVREQVGECEGAGDEVAGLGEVKRKERERERECVCAVKNRRREVMKKLNTLTILWLL